MSFSVRRIVRGGSCDISRYNIGAEAHFQLAPVHADSGVGFRLVKFPRNFSIGAGSWNSGKCFAQCLGGPPSPRWNLRPTLGFRLVKIS